MAVFRVEKSKDYTVMSNHHLRNTKLTLKAKGLLSQILSLPPNWNLTLKGLSSINKESIDAIRTAIWELEEEGYIIRKQGRDNKGKMTTIEYIVFEKPQQPELDNQTTEEPVLEKPMLENPISENPTSDNPTQLNKDINKYLKDKNKDLINSLSNINVSFHSFPIPSESETINTQEQNENFNMNAVRVYEEIIKNNIEYTSLLNDSSIEKERLDEIVSLLLETVCTRRKILRIAGDDYPAELVKEKFMKLNNNHIQFVFESMKQNTAKIRNIKKYLLAVLFNAPSTIDNYYTSLVNHDTAHSP